jgi:hypothetical protein
MPINPCCAFVIAEFSFQLAAEIVPATANISFYAVATSSLK